MTTIKKATEKDFEIIANIGKIAVELSHRESCSVEDMNEFLNNNYNHDTIKAELNDTGNIYHIIYYNEKPAGFTKTILNAEHKNIIEKNVTKLDRIYLLEEFFDLKLGYELLKFNLEFSKENNQSGMWLFTWTGNKRAVKFYLKTGFKVIASHKFKVTETHYNSNYQMFLKY